MRRGRRLFPPPPPHRAGRRGPRGPGGHGGRGERGEHRRQRRQPERTGRRRSAEAGGGVLGRLQQQRPADGTDRARPHDDADRQPAPVAGTTSAAAYRESCAAAFPSPMSAIPARTSATTTAVPAPEGAASATTASTPPAAAAAYPPSSPARRPRTTVTRVSARAPTPVATTAAVFGRPPQPVPRRSATTSVPTTLLVAIAALIIAAPANRATTARIRPCGSPCLSMPSTVGRRSADLKERRRGLPAIRPCVHKAFWVQT